MSIFGSFTDRMSNIFRVVQCEFRNEDHKHAFTTRSKMFGIPFRDPGTYPLARGRILPPDMRTDYIVSQTKFECFVGEKRKWVQFQDIFDTDIFCMNDFMVLVALGGEFDKDLPMYTEPEPVTEEDLNSTAWYWTNVEPRPDCSAYWNVVASHIEQNIKTHVRPGYSVNARVVPVGQGYDINSQPFRIELYINEIKGEKCYWFDINKLLQSFGGRSRMHEFAAPPTIIFRLLLSKDE